MVRPSAVVKTAVANEIIRQGETALEKVAEWNRRQTSNHRLFASETLLMHISPQRAADGPLP
jgi:hypothetical protein